MEIKCFTFFSFCIHKKVIINIAFIHWIINDLWIFKQTFKMGYITIITIERNCLKWLKIKLKKAPSSNIVSFKNHDKWYFTKRNFTLILIVNSLFVTQMQINRPVYIIYICSFLNVLFDMRKKKNECNEIYYKRICFPQWKEKWILLK